MKKTVLFPALLLSSLALNFPVIANDSKELATSQSIEQSTAIININKADIDELAKLKGIGSKRAQAIVEYRQKHGQFTSLEQLQEIKGIGNKILENNEGILAL
ncbi:ComEA family DNA-binding protein [Thalassotalea ganghwensis]